MDPLNITNDRSYICLALDQKQGKPAVRHIFNKGDGRETYYMVFADQAENPAIYRIDTYDLNTRDLCTEYVVKEADGSMSSIHTKEISYAKKNAMLENPEDLLSDDMFWKVEDIDLQVLEYELKLALR